jgi:hypothetical protein
MHTLAHTGTPCFSTLCKCCVTPSKPTVYCLLVLRQARYFPASRCIFASENICRLLPRDQVRIIHRTQYRCTPITHLSPTPSSSNTLNFFEFAPYPQPH